MKDIVNMDETVSDNPDKMEMKQETDLESIPESKINDEENINQEEPENNFSLTDDQNINQEEPENNFSLRDDENINQEEPENKANPELKPDTATDSDDPPSELPTLVKRKKYTKTRPSKKARLDPNNQAIDDNNTSDIRTPKSVSSHEVEFCLNVTNLPNNWSFMEIKNYIDVQCGPVDEIEMVKDDKTGIGSIRLLYQSQEECKAAMGKLENVEIEGTKLTVSLCVITLSDNETITTESTEVLTTPWKPDLDMWEIDPKGTYGLKESFLKSLGIIPPIDKWVHVSNFRCDSSYLRDVLEMAGRVLMCSVFVAPKYAHVMYTHPLEAVQAVSMLNGQYFFGVPLKVVMERSPANTVLLAKGLTGIGPGLGSNGKPLRNIKEHYLRYVTNQSASINHVAFENEDANENLVNETFQIKKVDDFNNAVSYIDKITVETNNKAIESPGANPIEPNTAPKTSTTPKPSTHPKITLINIENLKAGTSNSAIAPTSQQGPQNFQQRNVPNYEQYGPRPGPMWRGQDPRLQMPYGPTPGARPGWNMSGPMASMSGTMQGPRPMRPMGGSMQGPTQGPMQHPMQAPMQVPMQGSMQVPMQAPNQGMTGTMQVPMQRPMQGQMQRPMQGQMQRPMQVPMQGQIQVPMQGQMQGQMQVPMQGQMQVPMQGQMQVPMQGQMQVPMQGQMQVPMQGQGYNGNQPVQLHLSNLPPSTTFALLCEKMASCGQVVSIHLSTPGCAVVTFGNRMQADRCYQMYNNVCIEGCVIQVKYA